MDVNKIAAIVEEACRKSDHWKYRAWTHHIRVVADFAKILAKKTGADEEIVVLAALLHDYSYVINIDFQEEHHIHSARMAEELLKKYGYPEEKIEKVKHCILTHRGSKNIPRETIEAEVVASADALTHFNSVNDLLYVAFVIKKMDTDTGTKWVLDKLNRSWNKLLPEAKDMIKEKYDSIKDVLGTRVELK